MILIYSRLGLAALNTKWNAYRSCFLSRDVQACAARRRAAGAGRTAAGELQEILLQRAVSLLRRREISRLQILPQSSEKCGDTILLALLPGSLPTTAMMMMMRMNGICSLLLKVLLESRKIRLRRRKIPRL